MAQEIDYISEGKNADRFRRNFRGVPWVQTPVVHWAFTSPRVITLGYLPGTKVTHCRVYDPATGCFKGL